MSAPKLLLLKRELLIEDLKRQSSRGLYRKFSRKDRSFVKDKDLRKHPLVKRIPK